MNEGNGNMHTIGFGRGGEEEEEEEKPEGESYLLGGKTARVIEKKVLHQYKTRERERQRDN